VWGAQPVDWVMMDIPKSLFEKLIKRR